MTGLLALFVVSGTAFGLWLYRLSLDLPDVSRLAAYKPSQTTEIYSSDGILLARLFDENRAVVPLPEIPLNLRNATVAVEDRRFFQHRGVDWRGVARALVANVEDARYAQGASTITQQLVRNLYLSPDKRLRRKVREAMLAIRVERRFNKNEILGMYLNQVFYGARSFGVEAAARTYFGKSVGDMDLAQCALLAGIPQRPSLYDPYANPKDARRRRNVVLTRMAREGYITKAQAHKAMAAPLGLAYHRPPRLGARRAPYFVDYVTRLLEDRYGAEQVYRAGLRVQTTLNTRAQAAAESALKSGMNARFGRRPTQAALLSLDPTNGYIRAMVGGRDYGVSQFNRAVQARRQPGSAFKPFVYAAALNAGMTPMDRITDEPIRLAGWAPKNYDYRWHGRVTLTEALAQSINIPAIKLLDTVGITSAVQMARACGITGPLNEDLTLALGTSEVTMLDLTSAYATFAAGGYHTEPLAIVRVEDSQGRVLEQHYPAPEPVLDQVVARRMDFMLRQVVRTGTGRPAGSIPNARGKTGTTDELRDAWFVGYTPDLVTAVWVGNDKPSRIPGLTGGGECAPIWVAYMRRALEILPRHPLPAALRPVVPPTPSPVHVAENTPETRTAADNAIPGPVSASPAADPADAGVALPTEDIVRRRVCAVTGQLATRNCPEVETRTFAAGVEPTEYCVLHGARDPAREKIVVLCRDSGERAGPLCRNTITVRIPADEPLPPLCTVHARRRVTP